MSTRSAPPSPRKIARARARGDVALSDRAVATAACMAGLATVARLGAEAPARFHAALVTAVASGPVDVHQTLEAWGAMTVSALVPPLVAAALAASVVGALQTGLLFVTTRSRDTDPPTESRPPVWGRALFAVGLAIGGLALIRTELPGLYRTSGPSGLAATMRTIVAHAVALAVAVAVIDLVWTRVRHAASMRMTRDEQQREAREQHGDDAVRAHRRRVQREALAAIDAGSPSGVTWLVRDGARRATRLVWSVETLGAPVVLAHGVGEAARRMEQQATREGVGVVHDPRAARALERVGVGDGVPEGLFDALAAHVRTLRST